MKDAGKKRLGRKLDAVIENAEAPAEHWNGAKRRDEERKLREVELEREHQSARREREIAEGRSVDVVVRAWPTLTEHVQAALVTLVRTLAP